MGHRGGQIKETVAVSKALVKTSGNIVKDLTYGPLENYWWIIQWIGTCC